MNVFTVIVSWTTADGQSKSTRFNCGKSSVIGLLNQSLMEEVAPTFGQDCSITITDMGPLRGPIG